MRSLLLAAALLTAPALARADDAPASPDLTSIGLEDLLQLDVTSVSRHEEPLFRAASAITVLTADDIARSGATNIPDLLRTVPGMNVAQINANTWAVTARGFNGQYANKMLVLVDGRTVYEPLFSGVYWDVLDLLFEDIERIEVIRGPGGSAWGANAMNGVINVITRSAKSTPGTTLIARGGSQSSGVGGVRFVGPAGPSADLRLSAKYQNKGRLEGVDERWGHDALALGRVSGRLDWKPGTRNQVTVQGDAYEGTADQRSAITSLDPPYSNLFDFHGRPRGENLMGSWQHTFSAASDFRLKAYIDRAVHPGPLVSENTRTFDIDFQHRFPIGRRHDAMWGGGYRSVRMLSEGSVSAHMDPVQRTTQLENVFIQDAVTLVPERLTLTLGSKFEHNDFSGYEAEPSARLMWAASPSQTVWGAVSRTVRTPGPADEDIVFDVAAFPLGGGEVGLTRLTGEDMRSEIMTSAELGYRAQIRPGLSLELTTFASKYLHLRSTEAGAPFVEDDPAPTHTVFPLHFVNGLHASTRGLEGTVDWRPRGPFGVTLSHSLFWIRMERDEGSTADNNPALGAAPAYQFVAQPHVVLPHDLRVDATLYHVGEMASEMAPAYERLDARLGWNPIGPIALSVGVQNLFHDRDLEYSNVTGTSLSTTVRTGGYGKVSWKL